MSELFNALSVDERIRLFEKPKKKPKTRIDKIRVLRYNIVKPQKRYNQITFREIDRILMDDGLIKKSTRGSHVQYEHPTKSLYQNTAAIFPTER